MKETINMMDTNVKPLELSKVLSNFLKNWWVLLFSIVLLSVTAYFATVYLMTPIYRATSNIFIGSENDLQDELTLADVNLALKLANDYRQLIYSKLVFTDVVSRLPDEHRNISFLNNLLVNHIQDSRFIYVSYDDPNPERAMMVINTLSEVLKEHSLEIFGVKNMRIVDYAIIPIKPIRPSVLNNTLVGGFLGFLLAAVYLMVKLVYTDTVGKHEDIEKNLGLNVLGIIPQLNFEKLRTKQQSIQTFLNKNSLLIVGLRMVQANLSYLQTNGRIKTIMFTSALPNEGKTSTISSFAYLLASSGEKVLLIDCDLRRGNIHSLFNLNRFVGLTSYLAHESSLDEIINHYTANENLHIITTGQLLPDPTNILTSNAFKNFINDVTKHYNYVLIDTPPVLPFADVPFISRFADAIILIASSNQTRNSELLNAKNNLEKTGVRILGTLLTKAEIPHKQEYYAYYDYYNKVQKKSNQSVN